ncbi:MAG: hypothetical protein M3509_02370 [Chloroflexota bacterium]|nr:hypothetical protein [Chloroflexota bacterium]
MRRPSATSPAARVVAIALIAIGVVVAVGAFFADDLNITRGGAGLGWLQLIGVIVGLVVLLIGVAWLWQPSARRDIE